MTSTRTDVRAIGITAGNWEMRVAASATRGYFGEPLMTTPSYTTGTSDVNTVVVVTDNKPTVATDEFKGICAKDFEVNSSGTVIAHKTLVTAPIPYATRLRAKAETKANIDTDSELLGVFFDFTRFALTSGTYYFVAGGEANTGGLQIVQGNSIRGTLDAVVDARTMRTVIS